MKKRVAASVLCLAFAAGALPAPAFAAGLSSEQASAIVGILQAFGAEASVLLSVERILGLAPPAAPPPAPPSAFTPVPVVESPYKTSNLGFDYSYNAPLFPPSNFGFGLVGVTGGKSYTQNPRITQELTWAKFGAGAPPTLYMNLNAPYGSAANLPANTAGPESCAATSTPSAPAGGGPPVYEPTPCAGYNYGYNAAAYAYAYAKSAGAAAPLWWLDIEDANSWSEDQAVNDQTIQGAIDYLNKQGVRVGIYSIAAMWDDIAGASFAPAQSLNGQAVSTPTWVAIGIQTQIGAANSCVKLPSFIPGSPIWLIQYEASATAVDQNIAC
jgi:hypothetical protein